MTVNQISVFVENRPGAMNEMVKILQEGNVDLRALSLAETESFGVIRLITDDPDKTLQILNDNEYICRLTPVLAVEMADKPGALGGILSCIGDAGINMEYVYAFLAKKEGSAFLVLKVADNEEATRVLTAGGFTPLGQKDLPALFS